MAARILLFCLVFAIGKGMVAQTGDCTFKAPFYLLHFGKGDVPDVNTASLSLYNRVAYSCPGDGYYSFASSTSNCFGGDWHTLPEDHTPGDVNGNMLVVNSAYDSGPFLTTKVKGFKGGTTYQFGMWLLNLCRPTKKCPSLLLPVLMVRLQTLSGRTVAQIVTGDIPRIETPFWTQHKAQFTVPAGETELIMTMIDDAPGGCGNDFALDDISFAECVKTLPPKIVESKNRPLPVPKKEQPVAKKEEKKNTPVKAPVQKKQPAVTVSKIEKAVPADEKPVLRVQTASFVPAPVILQERSNKLAKHILSAEGDLQIDLYDNGEIDDDTVSIYHNNNLIVAGQRLSKKPITFHVQLDKSQPHHELVMVANNLGSIPPNTSMMIVTAKDQRHQVFISSTEQQNAKVIIDLKE